MSNGETNSCVICCEPLGNKIFGSTVPCGHLLHQECFDGWRASSLQSNSYSSCVKCPTCNSICDEKKPFIRLYLDLNPKPENNRFNEEDINVEVSSKFILPGFTDIDIQILVNGEKAGTAQAVLIDRSEIPRGLFLPEMDTYSYDTQWISLILFEPKFGRTKLKSLVDFDDAKNPFLYIKMFEIKNDYKSDNDSDVGAFALRKILRHPLFYKISSAVYVADGSEATTKEQEEIMARNDANQFLRNGFFQDKSYARVGGREARILVASKNRWERPLKLHRTAKAIQFCNQSETIVAPEGPDGKIFKYVKKESTVNNLLQVSDDRFQSSFIKNKVREKILRQLISNGGSVTESDALHVAITNNSFELVKILLSIEPKSINSFSRSFLTPLMCAAISAAERSNEYGIKDTNIIDYLLKSGANKDIHNQAGMTAYGKYLERWRHYEFMYDSIMGRSPISISARPKHASQKRLLELLCPLCGPTKMDLHGAQSSDFDLCTGEPNSGFVHYLDETNSYNSVQHDDEIQSYDSNHYAENNETHSYDSNHYEDIDINDPNDFDNDEFPARFQDSYRDQHLEVPECKQS